MNDKNEPTVFDRYVSTPPKLILIDGGKPDTSKQPYKAYRIDAPDNQGARIRIERNDEDRTTSSLARSYLVEWVASADQYLSLIFTTALFMIEGKNLDDLLEKLDDNQVNAICCFNPLRYLPPGENEPIITAIERVGFQEATLFGADDPPDGAQ